VYWKISGPVRPDPKPQLEDKYRRLDGRVFLSGVQALVRGILDQRRSDQRANLRTAAFISGYQGSPLGGLDTEFLRLGALGADLGVQFVPGLNEELSATAVYGSQLAPGIAGATVDGVTGVWFGKNPGLDRAMDALRHANYAGTHPLGGALAIVGDDPAAKSSTLPSAAEQTLAAMHMPTFAPGTLAEVVEMTQHAIACSRTSGLWSALKVTTAIADSAGTLTLDPHAVQPAIPTVLGADGQPYHHVPNGTLIGATSLALEESLFGPRLALATAYGRANYLNRVTVTGRDDWLGIVASGRVYAELRQAFADFGVDAAQLQRAGVRLMRVGMLYPHDREGFRAFGAGLEQIVVLEEKLPYLERALRDALYGTTGAPGIVGAEDEHGQPLVPVCAELDADAIALAIAPRITAREDRTRALHAQITARVTQIEARRRATAIPSALPVRTPSFCSGCPHNSSTKSPDDTLVGAGIGCHTMVLLHPEGHGTVTGITQMGGEGAQFIGMQPFHDGRHVVQNLGDGTFHHSASLAVRFAVATKLNITYKLLVNDVVAMTGAQDVVGGMDVPALTRWLALEGVSRVIVTSDDPTTYRNVTLDPIAELRHRDELEAAQAELAAVPGVTVLLHDQHCAADLRSMRRRGQAPKPATRVHINERVCEGCGDCAKQSSCMSVTPVDTEFGPKRSIHQSSCNTDLSCLKGDCPSFLQITVTAQPRAKAPWPEPPAQLPVPVPAVRRDGFTMRMPGVGGTGVVTVSQIVQMAALLDGRHSLGLDQTGLSQKGGPVVSDVLIADRPLTASSHAGAGAADLLLGFDIIGAATPRNLLVCDPERTVAVVNAHKTPTAAMVMGTEVRFPALAKNAAAIARHTRAEENRILDAEELAITLFGDHLQTNMLLLGVAYQAGCLPLSAAAIEEAISINGAAVAQNTAAFRWGRAWVAEPEALAPVASPAAPEPLISSADAELLDEVPGADEGSELRRLLAIRVPELVQFQNRVLARHYVSEVARVASCERDVIGSSAITEAVARNLYKLLAYKDEYEIARLHLDAVEVAKRDAQFGSSASVAIMLDPPVLHAFGHTGKLPVRRSAVPLMRTLRALKWLRGRRIDPFGRTEVRRLERALPAEYLAAVDAALTQLTPRNADLVRELAELPDVIRGYEAIKLANVDRYREKAAALGSAISQSSVDQPKSRAPIPLPVLDS